MRWVAWVALWWATTAVWADGCMVPIRTVGPPAALAEDRQRAAIALVDGVETLIVGITATGRAREAAWLVPVPATVTREQIDLARPHLLNRLFDLTGAERRREMDSPEALTRVNPLTLLAPLDLLLPLGRGDPSGPGRAAAGPSSAPDVRLQAAFELGPYHLDLLSARSGEELTTWLREHGYELPSGLGELAEQDLRLGRRFVAVRLSGDGEQAVPSELPPLRIAFPASQAWFPLRISRASAPPRVLLELVVVAPAAMDSIDLPATSLPSNRYHRLAERRRQAAVELGYAGLVREAVQPLEADAAQRLGLGSRQPERLWLTRYWSLLDRSAMVDLRFASAGPEEPFRAKELGRGHPVLPRWIGLLGNPWGPILLVLALIARGWRPDPRRTLPGTPPSLDRLGMTLTALVGLVVLLYLPLEITPRLYLDPRAVAVASLLGYAALLLFGVVLVAAVMALAEKAGESRFAVVGWLVLSAAAVALATLAWVLHHDARGLPWIGGYVLLMLWLDFIATVLAFGGQRWASDPRRAHRPFTILAALLCALAVSAELDIGLRAAVTSLTAADPEEAREPLVATVRQFRHDHGAWPRQLTDLTATSLPATGLDTAGNVVPLPATPWHRYLDELPPEPISGGRKPWRYDPSDELVVDAQWQFE